MNGKNRGKRSGCEPREGNLWMGLGLMHHPLKLRSTRKGTQEREHLIGSKGESGFCYELSILSHALCQALPQTIPFNTSSKCNYCISIIISISPVRKLKLSEVRKLVQGHIHGEWQW